LSFLKNWKERFSLFAYSTVEQGDTLLQ